MVSLPNVRHWETFWQLGRRGTWPRRDVGIFDRTHLRWFTLRDAYAMLDAAPACARCAVSRQYRLRPLADRAGTAACATLGRMPAAGRSSSSST